MQSLATVLLLLLTATLDPVNASPITPAGHRETEVEACVFHALAPRAKHS